MESENVVGVPEVDVATAPAKKKIKDFTEAERKAYQVQIQDKSRAKKKAQSFVYTSKLVATKSEALELLEQRIVNPHVREVCYDLGLDAAEATGIIPNKFYWQNGLTQALASKETGEARPLELDHAAEVDGEVIHRGDLYAIFDYSFSWREPGIDFESFIEQRHLLKTDAYWLGLYLGKDFHECHKVWADFFPRLKPTLRPKYSQNDMKQWLGEQSPIKDFLLMASRNAYKSSWIAIWALTMVLCCPDSRLLFVSETTKLSKGFIRAFRNYWEVGSEPTKFQYTFPEYCIPAGDGSTLSFECPLAHLGLIQSTAESTSMESSVVGQRADCIIFDDPISDKTTGTEEMCQKSIEVFSATKKLREVGGISIVIGTPWRAELDLYAVLLKRNEQDPEHSMAVRIDPAWTVKKSAQHKPLRDLREEDIEKFLFPERLSWKFLQAEMRDDASPEKTFFRSQNLVEFVASEEDKWAVTFTMDELLARVKSPAFFSGSQLAMTVAAIDTAYSTAMTADRSAIVIARIFAHQGKNVAFIVDVIADRWKYADLAVKIVEAFAKHNVQRAVIERGGPWQELQAGIQRAAGLRGVVLPHVVFKQSTATGISVPRKVFRIKGAQSIMENDQLYFAPAMWNDSLFAEMTNFNGKKSSTRKDDQVDGVGMLVESFLVRDTGGGLKPSPEQEEMERQAHAQELLRQQHQMYFGTGPNIPHSISKTPEPAPSNPLTQQLSRFGLVRPRA
jgi:predicted phage terminase large subunit-like protein